MIFDNTTRMDITPKRNSETSFDFLNRSARPEISRVREFVETRAAEYPASEIKELIARIRCGNEANFNSAMFELILYGTLSILGCKLEPHPKLKNGSTSCPDFLVSTPEGSQFYLEAVLVSEDKVFSNNKGCESIKGVVMDALASVSHQNFMISIDDEGYPTTLPSGKKLAKDVLKWLDSLDPDEVDYTIENDGLDAVAPFFWKHENWSLIIQPIPLKKNRRGNAKSLIGVIVGSAGRINAWTPIRNAIKSKGSKYGQLELPFLIAVSLNTFALDPIDEMQALFGEEQFVFSREDPHCKPEMRRAPNGLWNGAGAPQYTRVSGVWFFNNLTPYTIAVRKNTVYLNPWASKHLPECLQVMPHAKSNGEIIKWTEGKSLREIFGLHNEWPE